MIERLYGTRDATDTWYQLLDDTPAEPPPGHNGHGGGRRGKLVDIRVMYREENADLAQKLIDAIIKAAEELGHRVSVSSEYRNRRDPGRRIYIRVY